MAFHNQQKSGGALHLDFQGALWSFTFFQEDEKRINKGYVDKFKGVERITKCVVRPSWIGDTTNFVDDSATELFQFEERVEFYCPYYFADARPPYPK